MRFIPDGDSYYSKALGMEVRGRSHRNKVLKERGLRVIDHGEEVRPNRSGYSLSEDARKLHAYVKSHGVNWNLIEKKCPGLLPGRKPVKHGVNLGAY